MLKELLAKGFGEKEDLNCSEKILMGANIAYKLGLDDAALKLASGMIKKWTGINPAHFIYDHSSLLPHSPQKRVFGGFTVPQLPQAEEPSFAPHSPQNLTPSWFSAPQSGHLRA